MKKVIVIGFTLLVGINVLACQYGVDSSKRMDEVIQSTIPDATNVSADGLQDAGFSISHLFSNQCPSDFKLSGHLKFFKAGMACKGTIVLKYRDNHFSSGKIRAVSCDEI